MLIDENKVAEIVDDALKLRKALKQIADYPNEQSNHHPDECELQLTPQENWDEDTFCTCGYWALGFTQLKIIAMEALK